jgi:hypothetical protein
MRVLKAHHYYVMKKEYEKRARYVKSIIPLEDRIVPNELFNCYEDMTEKKGLKINQMNNLHKNNESITDETLCPECGAPWDTKHHRCTINCQNTEVFDEQVEGEKP